MQRLTRFWAVKVHSRRLEAVAEVTRGITESDRRSQMNLNAESRTKVLEFREKLAGIEMNLLEAAASTDVNRLNAVQPKLVEAIKGLGDKQVLAELAKNLPEAGGALGLLTGLGGINGLKKMVEGTAIERALQSLTATSADVETGMQRDLDRATDDPEDMA